MFKRQVKGKGNGHGHTRHGHIQGGRKARKSWHKVGSMGWLGKSGLILSLIVSPGGKGMGQGESVGGGNRLGRVGEGGGWAGWEMPLVGGVQPKGSVWGKVQPGCCPWGGCSHPCPSGGVVEKQVG